MRTRVSRRAFATVVAVIASTVSVLMACNSSDDNAFPYVEPPRECPVSVATAIGVPCRAGQACPIAYTCGSFQQQATCTCTSGNFACTDSTGAALHAGDTPACVPNPTPAKCPSTEQDFAKCSAAGQVCNYDGLVCPENAGVPNRDVCECTGDGDGGLVFHCVVAQCLPRADAGVPEAGKPEAGKPEAGAPEAGESDGATDGPPDFQ